MQDNKYDPRPTMAILLALASLLLGGGSMVEIIPSVMVRESLALICLFGALAIGLWMLYDSITDSIKKRRKAKLGYSKPLDSQNGSSHKNRQVSINIGINSGDFIDDKMSTKRMNDFHKMVKSISDESADDSK